MSRITVNRVIGTAANLPTATSSNTPNTLVLRSAQGDVAVGVLNANSVLSTSVESATSILAGGNISTDGSVEVDGNINARERLEVGKSLDDYSGPGNAVNGANGSYLYFSSENAPSTAKGLTIKSFDGGGGGVIYLGLEVDMTGSAATGGGGSQSIAAVFMGGRVGIGTSNPNTGAALDVTSTTQGFLPPRLTTTQRNAIGTPPAGLMVYNTTTNKLNFYNGTAWEAVTST